MPGLRVLVGLRDGGVRLVRARRARRPRTCRRSSRACRAPARAGARGTAASAATAGRRRGRRPGSRSPARGETSCIDQRHREDRRQVRRARRAGRSAGSAAAAARPGRSGSRLTQCVGMASSPRTNFVGLAHGREPTPRTRKEGGPPRWSGATALRLQRRAGVGGREELPGAGAERNGCNPDRANLGATLRDLAIS